MHMHRWRRSHESNRPFVMWNINNDDENTNHFMEIKKCSFVLLSISTGVQVNFSVCRITCYITRLDIDKYSKLVNWVLGGRHMDATLNMVIWQSGHTHRFITTSSDSTHDPVKGERSHPNLSLKPLWYYPCKLTPRSYGRLRVGQSECILNRNGVTSSHPLLC